MIEFFANEGDTLLRLILEHIGLSLISLGLGVLAAVPLGIILSQFPKIANVVIGIASVLQTVPTLALLALMVPLLGVGATPAIVALFIYSLLPILRNTYAGVRSVDDNILDVGKGIGMTKWQIIYKIEFPLSMSVIMGGVRNAFIMGVGVATLGTFVGASGLGDILQQGVNASDGASIIIAGVLPISVMAIIGDVFLTWVENKLDPMSH